LPLPPEKRPFSATPATFATNNPHIKTVRVVSTVEYYLSD
jgi:hypothetical protein